jgi:hypothetical protein
MIVTPPRLRGAAALLTTAVSPAGEKAMKHIDEITAFRRLGGGGWGR